MSDAFAALPGEQVTYRARLHPILFAPPIVMCAAGLGAMFWQPITALALLLASIAAVVAAYAKFTTTQIVITARRIIYKSGFIARNTVEMNKDKIESIDVTQPVLGRLLNFGAIKVKGTGGGFSTRVAG